MNYLKTFEEYDFIDKDILNESFLDKLSDIASKPFGITLKSILKKKTDDDKLNILEKCLKYINILHSDNYNRTIFASSLITTSTSIFDMIKLGNINIPDEVSIGVAIYWIIFVLVEVLKRGHKKEILRQIVLIRNDHLKNHLIKIVVDDPFGEEDTTRIDNTAIRSTEILDRERFLDE